MSNVATVTITILMYLRGTFCASLKSLVPATVLAAIATQYSTLGSKLLITSCEFPECVTIIVFVLGSTSVHVVLSVPLKATVYESGNPLLSSSVSWFQFNQISVALTLLIFTIAGTSGTAKYRY